MRRKREHACQMGVSSPRTLHSPRCWLASHLHTLLHGLGFVSILSLFLATLSRKGKKKKSRNLCSFLKPLRKRKLRSKQTVGRATALLPAEGFSQPKMSLPVFQSTSRNNGHRIGLTRCWASAWECKMPMACRSALPGLLQAREQVGHSGSFSGKESKGGPPLQRVPGSTNSSRCC